MSIIWQCLKCKIICSQRNDTKGSYISLSNVKTFSPPEQSAMPSWLLCWGLTRLPCSNNRHFGFYPARTPHCDHSAQKHCPVAALSSLHWNHSTEAEGHFNQDLPPWAIQLAQLGCGHPKENKLSEEGCCKLGKEPSSSSLPLQKNQPRITNCLCM